MAGRLAMACGVLGALWLLAMVVAGGATFPDYDHASQYISELGATGAPYGQVVSWAGFLPVGLLISAFSVFAGIAAPRSILTTLGFVGVFLFAIGYAGSAFFPCDYGCRPEEPTQSQLLHYMIGLPGYFLAPVTLLLLGLAAWAWPRARHLSLLGFACAAGALTGLLMLSPESPTVGIAQRVLEASMLSWVVASALYLGTNQANETAAP